MNAGIFEIQDTLREDGTLVQNQKPELPPGRVQVFGQPMSGHTPPDLWPFFERRWAEQRATGHIPRTREEIDAELAASRHEDEERLQQ